MITTPQSPERDWTVSDVKDAVEASGIVRERVFGDVLITFPGENDAGPDLTIVGFDAERRRNSYSCLDVLAVVEVPSEPDDEKDYVRNVRRYGRYAIEFCVIADPFRKVVTLMTEPRDSGHGRSVEIPHGQVVAFTLATGERVKIDRAPFPRVKRRKDDPQGSRCDENRKLSVAAFLWGLLLQPCNRQPVTTLAPHAHPPQHQVPEIETRRRLPRRP